MKLPFLTLFLVSSILASAYAQTQTQADECVVYKYTGNSFSLKFHRPSCQFARAMYPGNIIRFRFRKDAIAAGQKPCRYCLPPDWKSVSARILAKDKTSSSTEAKEDIVEASSGQAKADDESSTNQTDKKQSAPDKSGDISKQH